MSSVFEKIVKLGKQLVTTGRASNITEKDTPKKRLNNALSQSETRAFDDSLSVLDSILPDNTNFTTDDATRWEERLGLIVNPSATLDDRKAAILRKMNHPSDVPARSSAEFLEIQLQLAGFNVFVFENIPNSIPAIILSSPLIFNIIQEGDAQLGNNQMGTQEFKNKIVNHIFEADETDFSIVANYKDVFFLSGSVFGTVATVPLERKDEFRQLVLKLKRVKTVAFLYIDYT